MRSFVNELASTGSRSPERSPAALREWVLPAVQHELLAERVSVVLCTLPDDVLDDLLGDPCFRIALDDFVPGQGRRVWMAGPGGCDWKGSRSVVLKLRLAECVESFAHYIIAHELAHAYLWNGGWGAITDREEAADALAASWGFHRPA